MSATTTHAHAHGHHAPATKAAPAKVTYGLLAEFENPGVLYHAAEKVRDAGYQKWDCHTPFPVHGLDKAMGVKMTKLPILVFTCGLTGCILGVLLQWFTNAANESLTIYAPMPVTPYPFQISGKPLWSLPANVPVIFELTILLSAFGAVFGMLGMNRLPRFAHPLFTSKRFLRVTSDKFFIAIEATDPKFRLDETRALLQSAGAAAVEVVED